MGGGESKFLIKVTSVFVEKGTRQVRFILSLERYLKKQVLLV